MSAPAARRLPATRIAVTSGKGGVGKTSLTVNLGVALARLGHRVGIVDTDFALGNIDVLLGLAPEQHLGAVLDGTRAVGDVTIAGPAGVRIIPAGSGLRALTSLDDARWDRLVRALHEAGRDLDFLLFDTATGISDNVIDVLGLADYVLVLTSYEPTAVVDAYAVIKVLSAIEPAKPIGVVVNAAQNADEAGVVYRQIALAADRFLGRSLRDDGFVLEDRAVRDAIIAQAALLDERADSPAIHGYRRLAARLAAARTGADSPWPAPVALTPNGSRPGPEAPCA
jgi:flagellar biosynthesis protein FlhG